MQGSWRTNLQRSSERDFRRGDWLWLLVPYLGIVLIALMLGFVVLVYQSTDERLSLLRTVSASLFSLPVIYGAYRYGWKGGILTALASAAAILPYSLLHDSPSQQTALAGELGILFIVGAVTGLAISAEKRQDERYRRERERYRRTAEDLDEAMRSLRAHMEEIEKDKRNLEQAYLDVIKSFIVTLEARDPYTRGHAERVREFARAICRQMGLDRKETRTIELAAVLHDLGKIAIPDQILLKPGPLTPAEWAQMRRHPTKSAEIVQFLGFLRDTVPIIAAHQERYDGHGYPSGLMGEEIPLGARILAVADSYDAMTSSRPYRQAMGDREACQVLSAGAGTYWDPVVVQALLTSLSREQQYWSARV